MPENTEVITNELGEGHEIDKHGKAAKKSEIVKEIAKMAENGEQKKISSESYLKNASRNKPPSKMQGTTPNMQPLNNGTENPLETEEKSVDNISAMKSRSRPEHDKNRSKSDIAKFTEAMQKDVVNPGLQDTEKLRRKSDLDQIAEGVNNLKLSSTGSGKSSGGLISRGPCGGKGTNHRQEDYNRGQLKQPHSGFEAFGKRSRDNDGIIDYKYTKPYHNRQPDHSQIDNNSAAFLCDVQNVGDFFQSNVIVDHTSKTTQQNPSPYNVSWQNVVGSDIVNFSEFRDTVPDVDDNLDELYNMLGDEGNANILATNVLENNTQNATHIHRLSEDDGIDVSDMICSPPSVINLSSPDSGVGSPEGVASPLSPGVSKSNEPSISMKSPPHYVTNSPQQMKASPQQRVGSSHHIMGGPPQIIGSPQQTIGSPQQMIGSPQQMMGSPQQMIGSPQQMMGSPQQMIGSPQQMMGSPQQMMGSPQQMMGSPQHMIGSPQQMMGSPQQMLGNPQKVIGNRSFDMPNGSHQMMRGSQTMMQTPAFLSATANQILSNNPYFALNGQQYPISDCSTQAKATSRKQTRNSQTACSTKDPNFVSNHNSGVNPGLDMFFNKNEQFLNDVNSTLVDDLNSDYNLKKLLEADDPVIDNLVISTGQPAQAEKEAPVAEIDNVMQKSMKQSSSSLYHKFDGFICEDYNDGSGTPDVLEFIDSITQPNCDSQPFVVSQAGSNPRQMTQEVLVGNKDVGTCSPAAPTQSASRPIMTQLQSNIQQSTSVIQQQQQSNMLQQQQPNPTVQNINSHTGLVHSNPNQQLAINQQIFTSVGGVSNMQPIMIPGQAPFIVPQNNPSLPQPIVISSQLQQMPAAPSIRQQQPINNHTTKTQPITAGSIITSPLGTTTSGGQFIFLPVQVLPTPIKTVTDTTQNQNPKPKKAPAKAPRKILPKSPPVVTPSSSAPLPTVTQATRPSTYAAAPSKPSAMNGCLNVNSANKLNIARRCVANMTREDLQYKDCDGDTYLHVAVCRTDPHLVQAMLERIQRENLLDLIDAQNAKRQTPLYLAVAANQPVMVRLFVKCGADVNSMTQATLPDGKVEVKAAIHCAASGCNAYLNTIRELIQAKDVNLNLANSEGLTALHCAILEHGRHKGDNYCNSIGVVQLLIRAGADPNVQDKCSGKTPLMYAIQTLDHALVEGIMSAIDRIQLQKMMKTQTFDGSTCIRIACGLTVSSQSDVDKRKKIAHILMTATQNGGQNVWQQRGC